MRKKYWFVTPLIAALVVFASCESEASLEIAPPPPLVVPIIDSETVEVVTKKPAVEAMSEEQENYIDELVQETISKFEDPTMTEYEKAKAAFDYIIETTSLTEPIGLDLWRIRGNNGTPPTFVENRSISVLRYGVGMCEDYAAAYTMLLRGMGIEAEYVLGLTYSATGAGLVDHAWTVAEIDGIWYHFDPQLEDNISRRGTTRYKYFMKSDATMLNSHRWGQNLIDSHLLSPDQNRELAENYQPKSCPTDYPTPSARQITSVPMANIESIQAEINTEFSAYEAAHGKLPPLELNIIPPVFKLEGYGEPD